MENFQQNEVSIEGVDALDETLADSASLQVIENFLDTVDVKQFTLPVEFNERVMQEIFYMTTGARSFTEGSLNRMTAYDSMIYAQLDQMGMPKDLIYLALVESGFKVKAYSRAKASGMWQFIPETGKRYGLEVDYWVDKRRNPEMATTAALKYLKRLHDEFNDWLLAMAAYNCGEGRVRRLVKEMMADSTWDTTKVVTYWDLELPKETMRYVPRILAAMVIGHFPAQYEMTVEKQYLPDFDTVTVFDSFPLEEVAKLLKVSEDTLRALNMELVKWCTPPNKDRYLLRLPVGTRSAFVDGYDKMEKNSFSSWHHHKVKKGETLGAIARQYGISITELKQANDMKNDRIRAGKSLLIPIKVTPKKSTGKKPTKIKTYVVKPKVHILTSFFYPKIRPGKNAVLYPPIIREDILKLEPTEGEHVVVYQTSRESVKLVERLKSLKDEKFIVYGFNKNEVDENLTYKEFNEDVFYDDLASSKAVICNGGFTFITEAICLKKPIYSVPAIGNFEQTLNGFYVQKLGYGEYHEVMSAERVKEFLTRLPKYSERLKKVKKTNNDGIVRELKYRIEKYSR